MQDHRKALRETLAHREGAFVPLDLGSTKMTGISIRAYRAWLSRGRQALDPEPQVFDMLQQLARPSEAFLQAAGVSVRGLFPAPPAHFTPRTQVHGAYEHFTDEWGISWRMPLGHGLYFDLCGSPLAQEELTAADIAGFPWPDADEPSRYATLRAQSDTITQNGSYGVTLHGMTSGMLEMYLRLRGFENGLMELVADPDTAEAVLDHVVDIKIAYWQRALALLGGAVDVAVEADDLGTQNSLLLSPDSYRELVKPRHTRLFAAIHRAAPGVKTFLHTCGAVRQLIPDLIESGVDILNPVQFSAEGMDATALKRDFGRDLVFWGGGVDTQQVLPHGTPGEVREQVRRQIETLAPGGGFVFATVHNIQADVPPENLEALLSAIEEYR